MAIALGDLLYVDGDLSGGWEAGPPAPPKAFEEIMNTSAKVDRRLYLYGKVDGGVTGLVFTTQQEALSAMDTLTPSVATMFTGQPGQQVSAVTLLGWREGGVGRSAFPHYQHGGTGAHSEDVSHDTLCSRQGDSVYPLLKAHRRRTLHICQENRPSPASCFIRGVRLRGSLMRSSHDQNVGIFLKLLSSCRTKPVLWHRFG